MIFLILLALAQDAAKPAKPWKPDESVELAKKALKEDSKPEDWKAGLKAQIDLFLGEMGQDGALESLRWTGPAVQTVFDGDYPVVRATPAKAGNTILIESAAKGGQAKRVLLVCSSAEFNDLDDSVVVCLGDVKVKKLRKSLLLATGKVQAEEVEDAVVYAGGDLSCSRRVKHASVLARGKVESPETDDVVFVNTPNRKIESEKGTKDATNANLPAKK